MATNNRRPNQPQRRPPQRQRRRREKQPKKPLFTWPRRKAPEFRPDAEGSGVLKMFHLTQGQIDTFLKWGGYAVTLLLLHVIQDVIMSRIHIFGATTDLVGACILLITVIESTEKGSLFVLLASTLYYFTGSSPGPYTVALLTFLGIGASMFRQLYWHRSIGSILLCSGIATMLFELGVWITAITQELTRWDRLPIFALTGAYSCLALIPLYYLIHAIGQIGGNTWKE